MFTHVVSNYEIICGVINFSFSIKTNQIKLHKKIIINHNEITFNLIFPIKINHT